MHPSESTNLPLEDSGQPSTLHFILRSEFTSLIKKTYGNQIQASYLQVGIFLESNCKSLSRIKCTKIFHQILKGNTGKSNSFHSCFTFLSLKIVHSLIPILSVPLAKQGPNLNLDVESICIYLQTYIGGKRNCTMLLVWF